jgi:hypothetical protein
VLTAHNPKVGGSNPPPQQISSSTYGRLTSSALSLSPKISPEERRDRPENRRSHEFNRITVVKGQDRYDFTTTWKTWAAACKSV